MAVPTSYTEATLKAYMHTALGAVATALGITVAAGSYDEAVNETLIAYGVSDVTSATNMRKVRSLARREAWRTAQASAAGRFDFSADGASYSRSQMHSMIATALATAESDAAQYDAAGAYTVTIGRIEYEDPYQAPNPVDDARDAQERALARETGA